MKNMFEMMPIIQQLQEVSKIIDCNQKTEKFHLVLSEEDAKVLLADRKNSLMENQRIEFGESILPKLIYAFCDSSYLNQDNYVNTLSELQEIFYLYKNDSLEEATDDELISFMREQFDEICFGDLEYLSSTCLERFTREIRSGYKTTTQHRLRDEYTLRDTKKEYTHLAEETRWEDEVYKSKLEDLF